jgi:hypothetical protein
MKTWTSLRLSAHGKAVIASLSKDLGITKTGVIELAIRELQRAYARNKSAIEWTEIRISDSDKTSRGATK